MIQHETRSDFGFSPSAEFRLGYRLASASDNEITQALAHRPGDLALLRRLNALVERILPIVDRHIPTPNEQALSRIVPVRTVRSQRRITAVRLRKMQEKLSSPISLPGRQILAGREA